MQVQCDVVISSGREGGEADCYSLLQLLVDTRLHFVLSSVLVCIMSNGYGAAVSKTDK